MNRDEVRVDRRAGTSYFVIRKLTIMVMALFGVLRRVLSRKNPTLSLREAAIKDLDMVRGLLTTEATNQHFYGLTTPSEVEAYLSELRSAMKVFKSGQQVGIVLQILVIGQVPVGFAILRACPDPTELELHMLVISPLHRRQGYARTVVGWFTEGLKKSNRRLLVRCLPASKSMMNLLKELGFERKSSKDVYVRHFLSPKVGN